MPNSYGLVVEGEKDAAVFQELVRKIHGNDPIIHIRQCGGIAKLRRDFPALLRDLENVLAGQPVDKAIVIRDADRKEVANREDDLRTLLGNKKYVFREVIHFYIVRQAMDALLLADESAISRVARQRGGRQITRINENLEDLTNPKERLQRELQRARVPYTPAVCKEIASEAEVQMILNRCPSFQGFIDAVTDC